MSKSNTFIAAGILLSVIGFLLIVGYVPRAGLIWNILNQPTEIGVPYRYVLILALAFVSYGAYLRGKRR